MECFGACPSLAIDRENPMNLPTQMIGDQYFGRFIIILMLPENHDPHPMTEAIDPNRFSEVELPLAIALNHFAICGWNQLRQLRDFESLSFELHLPIALQVTHVESLAPMNVIEYFRIGKIGIHREIAWNLMLNHPINQFEA